MICNFFIENWINELPVIINIFTKRELTFIFSRDSKGYKSFPFCRYGYSCSHRYLDCPIPYFKPKNQITQLTLF